MAQALAQTWRLARNRAGDSVALNPWEALADRQLVAQALAGRPDAFGELVRRYQAAVYNVAYGRVFGAEGEGAEVAPPDPASGPEEEFLAAERGAELRRAILALPPHYRAAIELRHFQELSYEEIAATLGMPLSDVKSHLFRARKLLREAMGGGR
jgi:DNA-directed RNA polymerase specialized sigma subunit